MNASGNVDFIKKFGVIVGVYVAIMCIAIACVSVWAAIHYHEPWTAFWTLPALGGAFTFGWTSFEIQTGRRKYRGLP